MVDCSLSLRGKRRSRSRRYDIPGFGLLRRRLFFGLMVYPLISISKETISDFDEEMS
jgi:hypothetical protein